MELALYHPEHGYYTSGAVRTGRAGHFMTSAELDPSFGQLWSRGLEQVWKSCGRPDPFHVVEIGGGEGGFAAAILEATTVPFSYRLVERVEEVERRQRRRLSHFTSVSWSRSLDEDAAGTAARADAWCAGRLVSALEGGYAPDRTAEAAIRHLAALAS